MVHLFASLPLSPCSFPPAQANLQACGDRLFDEGLYEAARILFAQIPNYARLASTLLKLARYQHAVDAARKANSPKCWKEVRVFVCFSLGKWLCMFGGEGV